MRKISLLLLIAPLALVACGGSSSSVKVDPLAYVKHSAHKTADMPSEHMTLTVQVEAGPLSVSMDGSGDYSNTRHVGTFAFSMSVPGKNLRVKGIEDGTTVYASSPALTGALPAGKTWIKIDLAKLGKSAGGLDFGSYLSRTPTQALQQLEAAGTVTQVGTATIDGVRTTHFRVENLDVSKLPQGAQLEALAHPKYGSIDVWIGNANGYVYRETGAVSLSTSGQTVSETIRTDFSAFGEAVHVTTPPASAVFDETRLASSGAVRSYG